MDTTNNKHNKLLDTIDFGKVIVYIVIIIGCISMLIPFIWMILTAFKGYGEAISIPPTIFPKEIKWSNFKEAWTSLPFTNLYYNTFMVILIRIITTLITSSLAGYAFARINFPFKKLLFSIVLIQMMLPPQIFIIPQYTMAGKLGILNSILGLVFPGIVSAFGVFLMVQHFKSIPIELEEAATLDGCSRFTIYHKIMLPLSKSSLVALSIFTALFAYKSLMWPLISSVQVEKMTLTAGIATLKGQYDTNFPVNMAASFIAMLPMLILYGIFQKHFIKGIAFTGTKG